VEKDELVQKDAGAANCRILFGDPNWTNYDYSFEAVKTDGPFGVAAMFRAADFQNFLLFDLAGWQNRKYSVECVAGGRFNWITFDRVGSMARGQRCRVRIEVRDDHCRCFVGDKLIYDFPDKRLPHGGVGLRTWGGAVRVRDIKVTSPDGKVLWEGPPVL